MTQVDLKVLSTICYIVLFFWFFAFVSEDVNVEMVAIFSLIKFLHLEVRKKESKGRGLLHFADYMLFSDG